MKHLRLSAIACATSLIFAAPLFAQSQIGAGTSSSATTSSAPAASAAAPASSCAGLTGTALSDCQNADNASNALCFGMSGQVRENCVKSYYPNSGRAQAPAAKPDSGAAGSDSSGTSGASSSGGAGSAGTGTGGTGSSSGSSSGTSK